MKDRLEATKKELWIILDMILEMKGYLVEATPKSEVCEPKGEKQETVSNRIDDNYLLLTHLKNEIEALLKDIVS